MREDGSAKERASVIFEVAPDPNDARLTGAWRSLDQERRLEISRRVARSIAPRVLELFNSGGVIVEQVGSYLDDTNPSLALMLTKPGDAVEIAKTLGFVLSQDSMVVVSPKPLKGVGETGAVVIEVGDKSVAEIDAIYQRLRTIEIDGQRPIGGQTTANGQMVVLNFSDIDTDRLARAIDEKLAGEYDVTKHAVYAAFPEKQEYDYASASSDPRGDRGLVRQRARDLRAQAQLELEEELRSAGVILGRRDEERFSLDDEIDRPGWDERTRRALNEPFNGPAKKTISQRLGDMRKDFLRRFVMGVFDPFVGLKSIDEKLYMRARLTNGVDGGLEALVHFGHVYDNGGALDVKRGTHGPLADRRRVMHNADAQKVHQVPVSP